MRCLLKKTVHLVLGVKIFMNKQKNINSWKNFIASIISLYGKGFNDEKISAEFADSEVVWRGEVDDVKVNEEYAPGVAINMHPELFKINEARNLRADYLFLNVADDKKQLWKNIKKGEKITFRAVIAKSPGPFSAVQLSIDEDDPEVLLMLGLYDAEPVLN